MRLWRRTLRLRWCRRVCGAVISLLLTVRQILPRFWRARNLCNRQVVVDVLVQGQVALGDGVRAAGLVLVDQLMHVAAEDMLGVFVHVRFVPSLAEDRRTTGRTAADAHAREQLKGIDDRDDAADASQTFDAREARASDTSCRPSCLRTARIALCRLRTSSGTASGASASAAARDDPVEDNDA